MDTHTPLSSLPASVEQRIRNYRPRALTADEWSGCRQGVTTLVAAAPPADSEDAGNLLTSAVALIVWAQPKAGTNDLATLLAGPWINRFATEWRRGERPANTLRNHLALLHRLQRTAAGGDGARHIRRVDRAPRQTARPYDQVERAALFAALDAAPALVADTVRRAWQLADQGVVVPEAYEHGLAKADWEAARAWVKAHRLPPLDAAQLRRMWALHIASSRSLAEALDAGVTRNEVDGLRPHLPRGDSSATGARMREF